MSAKLLLNLNKFPMVTYCAKAAFYNKFDEIKGTVSLDNKSFLNSTHLLDIHFCANNNCNKIFILKKSRRFQNTH